MKRFRPNDPALFYVTILVTLWAIAMGSIAFLVMGVQVLVGVCVFYIFCAPPVAISLVLWGFILDSHTTTKEK